jgi:hypothetical protein
MSGDSALRSTGKHFDRCTRVMQQPNLVSLLNMIPVEEVVFGTRHTHGQRGQDFLLQRASFLKKIINILAESRKFILGEPDVG